MGSVASFHCSFLCCTRLNNTIPKSDLFIPQFDAHPENSPKKNNKKKLLKTTIINKKQFQFNRITTERFILSKPRIRNSYTENSEKIIQKEKQKLRRNLTKYDASKNINLNKELDIEKTKKNYQTQTNPNESNPIDYSKYSEIKFNDF